MCENAFYATTDLSIIFPFFDSFSLCRSLYEGDVYFILQASYMPTHTCQMDQICIKIYIYRHTEKNIPTEPYTERERYTDIHIHVYTYAYKDIHIDIHIQRYTQRDINIETYTYRYTHGNIYREKYI